MLYRKILVILLAFVLTTVIGYIDYITGQEILLTIFYLIPVALCAWFAFEPSSYAMAFINAAAWYYVQILSGATRSIPLLLYWESFILFSFLIIIAVLLVTLKKTLKRESEMARTDYLTGLANRRFFFEAVEAEISRSSRLESPFTIAYIDVDNFKNVNDTLGHHAGDRVLQVVADMLKLHTRKMDVVGRLGGDEFAVLLPTAGSNDVKVIMDKIRQSLSEKMHSAGYPVTFSIGGIVFKQFPGTAENAIKMADALMYEVKKEGKNSVKLSVF